MTVLYQRAIEKASRHVSICFVLLFVIIGYMLFDFDFKEIIIASVAIVISFIAGSGSMFIFLLDRKK